MSSDEQSTGAGLVDAWVEAQKRLWEQWLGPPRAGGTGEGAGEDGAEATEAQGPGGPAGHAGPGGTWAELGTEAVRAWAAGLAAMAKSAGAFSDGAGDWRTLAEGTRSFADLYWDTWEQTLGRLLESPDLGHTREITERFTMALAAWGELRRASTEYQLLLGEAWSRAWVSFLDDIGRHGAPASVREALRSWGETVDKVLIDVFATEEYAKVQGRLVNATMAYRLAERSLAELFLEGGPVATRTELDEANRRILELRRELREVRRLVREEGR